MKVYISGAISGQPLADAADRFASAASTLAVAGHAPVNPFTIPPHAGCSCPGAVNAAGAGGGHEWGCYLRGDLAAMLGCDAILMLPGWEASHGARLELTVASAVGLRVLWDIPPGRRQATEERTEEVERLQVLLEHAEQYARDLQDNGDVPDRTEEKIGRIRDWLRMHGDYNVELGLWASYGTIRVALKHLTGTVWTDVGTSLGKRLDGVLAQIEKLDEVNHG